MNKLEYIRSEIRRARVEVQPVRLTRLQTLLADAQAAAKNEMREVTEEDVSKSAEKFIKNIDKTLDISMDASKELICSLIVEKISYEDFVITDPLAELSLSELVAHFKAENKGAHEKKIAGLVMKTTKGKYQMSEVLAEVQRS